MGVLIGIVIVGFLIWAIYASYLRVLASKRYATHQQEAPDLNRFAEGSPEAGARPNDPAGPGSVT
jgi:hypothetical protein